MKLLDLAGELPIVMMTEIDMLMCVSGKAESVVPDSQRQLKGVMRVGLLAKGLLLHGNLDLQLVVLCQERPTLSLLKSIYEILPDKLTVSDVMVYIRF